MTLVYCDLLIACVSWCQLEWLFTPHFDHDVQGEPRAEDTLQLHSIFHRRCTGGVGSGRIEARATVVSVKPDRWAASGKWRIKLQLEGTGTVGHRAGRMCSD